MNAVVYHRREHFFTAVRRLHLGLRDISLIRGGEWVLLPPAADLDAAHAGGRE